MFSMQLCLTLEHRFLQTPDQKVWTITQCPYDFYREYLDVFDSVRVISRAFPVARVEPNFLPVEGPGVEFYTMPGYKGPFEFLGNFVKVRERAKTAVSPESAVLFRLPSQVANSVEYWQSRRKLPYAVEVVADPYDVLGPAANRHVVAPIARRYFTRKLQQQCRRAIAVSYVTKSYLQQRYPPAADHSAAEVTTGKGRYGARQYATAVSDVNLSPECFASQPRMALRDPSFLQIVFVGTLESLYKGPDVLLEAVAICKNQGIPFKVRFMGIGQQMTALRKQCLRLGIDNEVEFLGSVTAGEPVRRELDRADLFVLPSRAEGVPRAMLEAMARGLPCIGSSIGGIPELLHQEDLVPADNPAALAKAIGTVFADRPRVARMSARNLHKAASYSTALLSRQRQKFYRAVKELTRNAYSAQAQDRFQSFPSSVETS
jgi:glycosyltransferase involved in cell wall biosynthesis